MSSFNTALSGLNAAQTDLDVSGHNIANASTVGFKQSRAEFADIYANSVYDVSATSPGRGVRVSRVAQQFSQGTVDFTGNNMDLAINGNGFFIIKNGSGTESYTRAGQFGLDREGYIVTADGEYLQAFAVQGDGTNYAAGDVKKASPGTSGLGLIQAGANEQSNVDLAEQLVQLIIAQRNYQANAKTIETANQITQTMVNIR